MVAQVLADFDVPASSNGDAASITMQSGRRPGYRTLEKCRLRMCPTADSTAPARTASVARGCSKSLRYCRRAFMAWIRSSSPLSTPSSAGPAEVAGGGGERAGSLGDVRD